MDEKRIEQLLETLEIIAHCIPPPQRIEEGDVPTHHFWAMQALAARALTAPETLEVTYSYLKNKGWTLP